MDTLIDELPKEKNYALIQDKKVIIDWYESSKKARIRASELALKTYIVAKIVCEVTIEDKGPIDF